MFAKQLKKAMEVRGMSAKKLSDATGIGNSSISQYLAGKNTPRDGAMQAIADALDFPLEFFKEEFIITQEGTFRENNLSVVAAAKLMGVTPQFIRIGLQRHILPFGYAVKFNSEYRYYISPVKFTEHTGISIPRGG